MSKCKCKKRVQGVGSTFGGIESESLLFLGAGAIGSMALTNPLENAIYKGQPAPNWFSPLLKFGMGYAAHAYTDDDKMHAVGVGAIAVGFIELAKAYFPSILGRAGVPGGLSRKSGKFVNDAIFDKEGNPVTGADYYEESVGDIGNVIDLNDPKWDTVSGYNDDYPVNNMVMGIAGDDLVF
jgi:hypothetical protein